MTHRKYHGDDSWSLLKASPCHSKCSRMEISATWTSSTRVLSSQPTFEADNEELQEDYRKFFDNISGEELPPDLVAKASQEEICGFVRSICTTRFPEQRQRAEALDPCALQPSQSFCGKGVES